MTKEEPDYFSWPFIFVVKVPMNEMEESEFWRKWLDHWQPDDEWMQ